MLLKKYQQETIRNLSCKRVQCDEIWSFCYAKQKNVPADKQGQFGNGDVWTWTALCADTKLICKVLQHPELKKRDIVVIGHYATDGVFAVLAPRGEKVFPLPRFFHLVENGPANPDPDVDAAELDSILRRFGYFQPISTFSAK